MRMGLQGRYVLSTSLLIIVVVSALSATLMWHFREVLGEVAGASTVSFARMAEEQLQNHGLEYAFLLAQEISARVVEGDTEKVHALLENARLHHSVGYVLLFDREGRVVPHPAGRGGKLPERVPEAVIREMQEAAGPLVKDQGMTVDVFVPVGTDGKTMGTLWIAYSKRMTLARLNEMNREVSAIRGAALKTELSRIALVTGLLLIVGIILADQLGRRLTRPIRSLAVNAARIGRGLPAVVDVRRADEVGELAAAFGAMQESLRRTTVSKEFLGGIIHSLNEGLLVAGPEMQIRLANRAAWEISGYSEGMLIGRSITELILTTDHCGELVRWHMGEDGTTWAMECRLRRHDGSEVPVSVSRSSMHGEGYEPGAVFVIQDISEHKRMEEQLRLYRENLEQLVAERTRELSAVNRELESFSYSVSHDLRSPLRALNGFSQVLLEDYSGQLDEEGRSYLERIRAATERMSSMIDGMLTLSRVARREIEHQPVDLSVLAAELAGELEESEPERRVRFDIAPGLDVVGDAALLRLLLQNLLNNAFKFTAERESALIEVGAEAGESGNFRTIFVRDNGAGFDMEMAERLFKPFQRLHAEMEYEGSGIGLATVQRIVLRHGGRVWAEGMPGEGATFRFTLPSA